MLGDAYFQLRAQVGTALFSLLRLGAEAGAPEGTLKTLQAMQGKLRESYTFAALGPKGSGKSTLFNTLFAREFCGPAEPVTVGKVAIFHFAEEPGETSLSPDVIECHRPHGFLRDFTVIEAPAEAGVETLAPLLARADVVFYVINAATGPPEMWPFLSRFGRDLLKRLVFVVWQSDRVSSEQGAKVVKRLRQAMLKHLGQACPIFIASASERAGREKLERWIENEVILAESRRARLLEIGEAARAALREIVAKPRAESRAVEREMQHLHRSREELAERVDQSKRHVAGALWALAQTFDELRLRAEDLLRASLSRFDLLRTRAWPAADFAEELEILGRATFSERLRDQLTALEAELQQGAEEFLRASDEERGSAMPKRPGFFRAELEKEVEALDKPLDLARVIGVAVAEARRSLRLPLFAVVGAVAVAAGVAIAGRPSPFLAVLAAASLLFVGVLASLLRRNIVAGFGSYFTANRAALLQAMEPVLQAAAERFYTALAPAQQIDAQRLAREYQRHQPLLMRLRQIEETFTHIESDLRTGLARMESAGKEG
jgi:hypothetical protein